MEPTTDVTETRGLDKVIRIDEAQAHLSEMVRSSVEETLNALLDAEAAELKRLHDGALEAALA